MQYYFIDWVAMALSLLAVYLLGQKNRLGFVSFMLSNVLWAVVGLLADSMGIFIGNLVFLAMNLHGFLKWRAAAAAPEGVPPAA